ncbi:MAG: gliding motility-associated C-terminal domain-containing protein [Bacteroidetes bacterium]|nr:gliding motility-associated C-terminal domain-containing protein [Bacteroidota bacterium]
MSERGTFFLKKGILLYFFILLYLYSDSQSVSLNQKKWINKPFEHKEFIENVGQFTAQTNFRNDSILYAIDNGGVQIYFTTKGLTFRHDKLEVIDKEKEERERKNKESVNIEKLEGDEVPKIFLLHMEWQNANANPTILAEIPSAHYFTYPDLSSKSNPKTFIAHTFRKIIYKNIYPNIDVEYVFHEVEGIKYSLILHPGANPSQVAMKYTGAKKITKDESGNILFATAFGDVVDHAPITFYDFDKRNIPSGFYVSDSTIYFKLGKYDTTKMVVIDPWVTNPTFATVNKAYDVGVDAAGNIYVSGSGSPWKIEKLNSAGVPQWTYLTVGIPNGYGDFAVDNAGNSYGAYTNQGYIKLNTAGTLLWGPLFTGDNLLRGEPWGLQFDNTLNRLIIAGASGREAIGSLNPATGANTAQLSLSTTGSEIKSIAQAPNGKVYSIASSKPSTTSQGFVRSFSPSLVQNWSVPSGYTTFAYYCAIYKDLITLASNNSIAASNCYVYTYEGVNLKKRDAVTGNLISSVNVFGAIALRNSGIEVDKCEYIYVGTQTGVTVYDQNLNFVTSAASPGAVYDVYVSATNEVIVCGDKFVQSLGQLVAPCIHPPLNTTISIVAPVCGSSNGSATVTPTNGTAPYSYSWSNGQTNSLATGLSAGAYTLYVADASCPNFTDTTVVTINSANGAVLNMSQTNVNCGLQGSATVTPVGGNSPFTYLWNNGSTQQMALGLTAGTYTVAVTDNAGCFNTQTVVILNNSGITVTTPTVSNVSCFGSATGIATVGATGGTGALSYVWSNGQTTATATALPAGNYSVTIQDVNGCTGMGMIQITQPPILTTGNITSFNGIACHGGTNGSIAVAPTGGNPGYSFVWSNGQTTSAATGLTTGSYTLNVTDASGCSASSVYNLPQPPILTVTANVTNTDCGLPNNGFIGVSASGGTPNNINFGYAYLWNTGATTGSINTLTVGVYSLTVTDFAGCAKVSTYSIGVGNGPPLNASFTPSLTTVCLGSFVTFTNTGSVGSGYMHSWAVKNSSNAVVGNAWSTSLAFTFSVSGQFVVSHKVVKFSPFCSTEVFDTITVVPCVTVTATGDTVCAGACATVSANGIGGLGNYSYLWNTGATTKTITACPLATSTYTVILSDSGGDRDTTTATITINSLPTSTITPSNVQCNGGNNGSAVVSAGNGISPYTYLWQPGNVTAQSVSGLSVGTYSLIVTDAFGCSSTNTVSILQPTLALGVSVLNQVSASCFGLNDGWAAVSALGGTGTYSYLWSNAAISATNTGLVAGTYSVTVTDGNNCSALQYVVITEPAVLSVSVGLTNVSCNGGNNGSALVITALGGTPTYAYMWSDGQSTIAATGLAAGTYTLEVKDANNCTATTSVQISQPPALILNSTKTDATCFASCDGSALVQTVGGNLPFTYYWNSIPAQTASNATGLCAGIYAVTVTDGLNCVSTTTVQITEPSQVVVNISGPTTICLSQSVSLTAASSGGIPGYQYWWSTGETSAVLNISPSVDTVLKITAIDSRSCNASITTTIDVGLPLQAIASPSVAVCAGDQTTLSVNATGGNGNYTFTWIPSNANGAAFILTPTLSATYTVIVNDNCGTPSDTVDVFVLVNQLPVMSISASDTAGCPSLCVVFDNSTPNTQSVNWQFGDGNTSSINSPTHCFTQSGSYQTAVIVFDNNGCSNTMLYSQTIQVYPIPLAGFEPNPATINLSEGQIQIDDLSFGAVNWFWSFSNENNSFSTEQNPIVVFADTGTYIIKQVVSNQYGCIDSVTKKVTVTPDFILYISNTFSPNGDGINEFFAPTVFGIKEGSYSLKIFNRWGELIWETQSVNAGWDGKINGTWVQEDTYVWQIQVKDLEGIRKVFVGHVNVVK